MIAYNRSVHTHRIGWGFIALACVALLTSPMAINIASQSPSDANRGHSDAGGQAASPSGPQLPQEEQVRAALARQYTQPYGATDDAIRNALGMRGPTADFVGHNAQTGRWLIAESKGSDLWKAYEQLQNTAKGLLTKQPGAQIELRIYTSARNYDILHASGRFEGYTVNAENHLGWVNGDNEWVYALVEGTKVLVLVAP